MYKSTMAFQCHEHDARSGIRGLPSVASGYERTEYEGHAFLFGTYNQRIHPCKYQCVAYGSDYRCSPGEVDCHHRLVDAQFICHMAVDAARECIVAQYAPLGMLEGYLLCAMRHI